MKYEWMLMVGSASVPVKQGTRRCSSPARLARWLRKHRALRAQQSKVAMVWYRLCDRYGHPMGNWQKRPLAASV